MTADQIERLIGAIRGKADLDPLNPKIFEDWFAAVRLLGDEPGMRFSAYQELPELRRRAQYLIKNSTDSQALQRVYHLIGQTWLYAAQDDFDSYCIYLEWRRPPDKKFYLPRRRVLRVLAQDLQDLADRKIVFLGVSLPPRVGKLVADNTPVLTRNGWKNHGDLAVGDEVISPNGEFVKVLAVHPKHVADYEVEFTNGEKILCHGNHEWLVYNRHKMKEEVLETRAMVADYESAGSGRGHRYFYQLPQKESLRGEYAELPVNPYMLGVWLGDGTNRNPTISENAQDMEMILPSLRSAYPVAWSTVHKNTGVLSYGFDGLRADLQKLGMCHSRRASEKHIPAAYLTASYLQRMELLAGLLDTDGTLRPKEHRYSFSTVSERLRDDFVSLVSTFGWRCSVVSYHPKVSSSGIEGRQTVYTVSFNPTTYIPCRVPRKQLSDYSKPRRVAIKCIRKTDPVPGNCITVEGGLYCVGKTLLPTHNSTLCIFFITWLMGKYPDSASVMTGHSDKLTDGFYGEALTILTDNETYNWNEVFPGVKMVDKSAKNETIDLNRKKRFPTLTCRSIGGTLTGAVEIGENGVLYSDDLIEDLEESLNPARLDAKYAAYLNQAKDRKKLGALELMVGTRWNVLDPLGRISEQYKDDPKYRFRVIPALDENDHSNFNYDYGVGFDDAYYHDMRASIDHATWLAKYQGNPVVREGLLFPREDLRWYNGVLPDGEPDRKLMVADIAWGGGDFFSAPVAYVYGTSVYVQDVVFSNADKTVTKPAVCAKICQHMPHTFRGEANNGGDEYCDSIDGMLREQNVHVSIRSQRAPNTQSKLSRILQYAPDIKQFYFVDDAHSSPEYRAFMGQVTTFTSTGKNPHDDAPDSLAMLAEELTGGLARVTVINRPF